MVDKIETRETTPVPSDPRAIWSQLKQYLEQGNSPAVLQRVTALDKVLIPSPQDPTQQTRTTETPQLSKYLQLVVGSNNDIQETLRQNLQKAREDNNPDSTQENLRLAELLGIDQSELLPTSTASSATLVPQVTTESETKHDESSIIFNPTSEEQTDLVKQYWEAWKHGPEERQLLEERIISNIKAAATRGSLTLGVDKLTEANKRFLSIYRQNAQQMSYELDPFRINGGVAETTIHLTDLSRFIDELLENSTRPTEGYIKIADLRDLSEEQWEAAAQAWALATHTTPPVPEAVGVVLSAREAVNTYDTEMWNKHKGMEWTKEEEKHLETLKAELRRAELYLNNQINPPPETSLNPIPIRQRVTGLVGKGRKMVTELLSEKPTQKEPLSDILLGRESGPVTPKAPAEQKVDIPEQIPPADSPISQEFLDSEAQRLLSIRRDKINPKYTNELQVLYRQLCDAKDALAARSADPTEAERMLADSLSAQVDIHYRKNPEITEEELVREVTEGLRKPLDLSRKTDQPPAETATEPEKPPEQPQTPAYNKPWQEVFGEEVLSTWTGFSGTTYRPTAHSDVVVKVFNNQPADQPRELQALQKLQGLPHVVKLLGEGGPTYFSPKERYLVKEFIDGEDMRWPAIEASFPVKPGEKDPFPESSVKTAAWLVSSLEAIAEMHSREILISDFKFADFLWDKKRGKTIAIDFANAFEINGPLDQGQVSKSGDIDDFLKIFLSRTQIGKSMDMMIDEDGGKWRTPAGLTPQYGYNVKTLQIFKDMGQEEGATPAFLKIIDLIQDTVRSYSDRKDHSAQEFAEAMKEYFKEVGIDISLVPASEKNPLTDQPESEQATVQRVEDITQQFGISAQDVWATYEQLKNQKGQGD